MFIMISQNKYELWWMKLKITKFIWFIFQKIDVKSSCEKCGGYRYMPCNFCHGSKKSLRRNHFTDEFCALRCMQCDENGLLRCDLCLDQQEWRHDSFLNSSFSRYILLYRTLRSPFMPKICYFVKVHLFL